LELMDVNIYITNIVFWALKKQRVLKFMLKGKFLVLIVCPGKQI
jgi:hypothetical protein